MTAMGVFFILITLTAPPHGSGHLVMILLRPNETSQQTVSKGSSWTEGQCVLGTVAEANTLICFAQHFGLHFIYGTSQAVGAGVSGLALCIFANFPRMLLHQVSTYMPSYIILPPSVSQGSLFVIKWLPFLPPLVHIQHLPLNYRYQSIRRTITSRRVEGEDVPPSAVSATLPSSASTPSLASASSAPQTLSSSSSTFSNSTSVNLLSVSVTRLFFLYFPVCIYRLRKFPF